MNQPNLPPDPETVDFDLHINADPIPPSYFDDARLVLNDPSSRIQEKINARNAIISGTAFNNLLLSFAYARTKVRVYPNNIFWNQKRDD